MLALRYAIFQEDSRLEDLEQTCRNLMEMLNKQNLQIEALKRENLEIRSNFSNLIGKSDFGFV